MNFIPESYIYSATLLAMSWSKPLRNIDLTMTLTSIPSPCIKPAHYNAIYEAPTIKVFPGFYFIQNISSDDIPYSLAPGISG